MTTSESPTGIDLVTARRTRWGRLGYATAAVVVMMAWPAEARIDSPAGAGESVNAATDVSSCSDSEVAEAAIAPPQVLGKSGTPDRVQADHGWLLR